MGFDRLERKVVGVNWPKGVANNQGESGIEEFAIEEFAIEDRVETEQVARLREFRAKRDQPAATAALAELRRVALTDNENLMDPIVEAVRKRATLGEICNIMREVFGEHRDNVAL